MDEPTALPAARLSTGADARRKRHAPGPAGLFTVGLAIFGALGAGVQQRPSDARPPDAGTLVKDCPDCPELLVIPAGRFLMGSPADEPDRDADEGPRRSVTFARPFAVGKYEVTFDEWDACVAAGGCPKNSDDGFGRGRRPVIRVGYDDAIGYAEWLSKKTGKRYRLLSEAEWEYAARAGSPTARFWGATADRACEFENVADEALAKRKPEGWKDEWGHHACDDGHPRTAPVGAFEPNGFGLHDMLGNVSEWVGDCYSRSYEGAPADGRAWATVECGRRVIRGGNWSHSPAGIRAANRNGDPASLRNSIVGFRVARDLP